ncbi:papain fold toxin domain-containing protein [Oscillatoria salina]|uniref:papain fold toxin domain-containing protein n=1 Tax=Oscillatoria salina TaxID=331517 RepID=UPI0013BAA3AA|nr:papain fold toxin domain-containing protein [Oscillatoria salina]MBZ8178565.1 hypothetical protein [Oscillatoria salina IIICB1]NET90898.1 hypothetical protein [Kamptonema sp. SIO1D9]
MSNLSDEEIYAEIGTITSQFQLLECDECALAVINWLTANGIEGKVLRLRTRYPDEDYIVSDRVDVAESITINGRHYGVEVRGKVFDNLSNEGMRREDWLNDFHCPSEEFILEELE